MLISQAQRDDDEEWHGTWGSEDGTEGQGKKRVQRKPAQAAKPEPVPAARPTAPAPPAVALAAPAQQPMPEADPAPEPRPKPRRKPKPKPIPSPPEVAPELDRPKVEEPPDPNAPPLEEPPAPEAQAGPARPLEPAPAPVRPEASPRLAPVSVPVPREEIQTTDSESNFYVGLDGGLLIQRGGRIEPAGGLELGWNLGKLLGWSGLYLEADVDIFIGQSPLGAEYIMLDTGLGFGGRFGLGPVKLLVGLEFVLRDMFITQQGTSTNQSPQLGFGAGAGIGLAVPLTDWLDLHLGADGRYARQPLTKRFEFTAVVSGGVGFSF